MKEGNIDFTFPNSLRACKFDATPFYKNRFNLFNNSKGVDFLVETDDKIYFIEVKNCAGYEPENRWRTKKGQVKYYNNKYPEEGFDIEVTKKTAMSMAALMSTLNHPDFSTQQIEDLRLLAKSIAANKPIVIVLFLEGDFKCDSRDKKMIMKNIQDSIKSYCKWIYNCQVRVIDSQQDVNFIKANILKNT